MVTTIINRHASIMPRLVLPLLPSSESGCGTHPGGTVLLEHFHDKDDLFAFPNLFCATIIFL